jgi:hypothetical protein
MASCAMISTTRFMKICTEDQEMLRLSIRNLRGCNVGNTDGKGLLILPLRLAQVP